MVEKHRWLAAVIAAHPEHKLVGRTRLQKTVKLLQRLGAPLDYDYMLFFYGPYSEGVQADIRLLENFGLVTEEECTARDGQPYYTFTAHDDAVALAKSEEFTPCADAIVRMSAAEPVVLELAATYDTFREMGSDHEKALKRLRRKKGRKCEQGGEEKALALLRELGLQAS